jgi:hypothetical protein
MAASDAVPVIVGAAIGAGGAVIAQITAAVFTARRERRQLDWDKERQAREWKMREDERFLSLKQDLYTSYSVLTDQFWMAADKLVSYDGKDGSEKPKIPDWNELERLERNIQLIGPSEVSDAATDCYAKLLEAVESGVVTQWWCHFDIKCTTDTLSTGGIFKFSVILLLIQHQVLTLAA